MVQQRREGQGRVVESRDTTSKYGMALQGAVAWHWLQFTEAARIFITVRHYGACVVHTDSAVKWDAATSTHYRPFGTASCT